MGPVVEGVKQLVARSCAIQLLIPGVPRRAATGSKGQQSGRETSDPISPAPTRNRHNTKEPSDWLVVNARVRQTLGNLIRKKSAQLHPINTGGLS